MDRFGAGGRTRKPRATRFLDLVARGSARDMVPLPVVTERWRGRTNARETILGAVEVVASLEIAKAAGIALANSQRVNASLTVDAIVMATAAIRDAVIVTADPADFAKFYLHAMDHAAVVLLDAKAPRAGDAKTSDETNSDPNRELEERRLVVSSLDVLAKNDDETWADAVRGVDAFAGGQPYWVQDAETSKKQGRFLCQMNEDLVPGLNLGDGGTLCVLERTAFFRCSRAHEALSCVHSVA